MEPDGPARPGLEISAGSHLSPAGSTMSLDGLEDEVTEPLIEEGSWHMLHPASVAINLLPRTWLLLQRYWWLLLALAMGQPSEAGLMDWAYILVLMISGVITSLIHTLTLRYRFFEGRLEIRQGLIFRESIALDPARIQNVSRIQNPFHKLAGLVELRVETAGDARTEGLLSALREEAAGELMEQIQRYRSSSAAEVRDGEILVQLGGLELLAAGLSSGHWAMALALLLTLWQVFIVVDPQQSDQWAQTLQDEQLLGLFLLSSAAAWILMSLWSMLRYYNYTLRFHQGALEASWGLLTRRRVQIPLSKLHWVMIEASLLRRWMGCMRLSVQTAGIRQSQDGSMMAELEIPILIREHARSLLELMLRVSDLDLQETVSQRPPARAIVLETLRRGFLPMIFGFWLSTWLGLPAAILLSVGGLALILDAGLNWTRDGWGFGDQILMIRRGFLTQRLFLIPCGRIQGAHVHQGPLLAALRMKQAFCRLAGGRVALPAEGIESTGQFTARLQQQPRWVQHAAP